MCDRINANLYQPEAVKVVLSPVPRVTSERNRGSNSFLHAYRRIPEQTNRDAVLKAPPVKASVS